MDCNRLPGAGNCAVFAPVVLARILRGWIVKIKLFKNGACVITDKAGCWHSVTLRNPAGEVHDKVRCEDYAMAKSYVKAFAAVARNL